MKTCFIAITAWLLSILFIDYGVTVKIYFITISALQSGALIPTMSD